MKAWLRYFLPLLILALLFSACAPQQPETNTTPSTLVTEPSYSESTQPSQTQTPSEETTAPTQPPTEETTQPVVTEPPATQPTVTEPPVTQPPAQLHSCPQEDPYENVDKAAFYANYQEACCLTNALYRSEHGLLSGSTEVPGQAAQDATYRPTQGSKYIRNTTTWYEDDGCTYVVVDAYGYEVMRLYKGGGYITLEEVAAYMFAFGGSNDSIPANYTVSKKTRPSESIWGEYLRVNHSRFSGDTSRYPYEPVLPDISGCGGDLQYYEMDIGTTGTVTSPEYPAKLYNNGTTITRGAARIVYARQDKNHNGYYENDEVYVFYTDNHYNDFREYLNYYGGWGQIFGNITGGGTLSSKTDCNPTPYVPTAYASFFRLDQAA